LPDSLVNEVYRFLPISKLRESLVVSAHVNMVTKIVCGVWMMVMEDDGNVASFKKLFNIDTFNTSVVYEPWSEHMTNLGIYGVDGSFFMDSYRETLLLLDHSDGFVYSDMM
ncbi:hypothetical protein Tco_0634714, partial [Tanacetum coccineum]